MKNDLEKRRLPQGKELNSVHYLQWVMQEARRLKLATDAELENARLEAMRLLAAQVEHYTGGESSSVRVETAQRILQSTLYSIGIHLKDFPDLGTGWAALEQEPISNLHKRGQAKIKEQLDDANELLRAVKEDHLATDNIAYNDTIETGIPAFFSAYDPMFAADDTPASIDYPLNDDLMELTGVEYIRDYLQKLSLENQFCRNFAGNEIHCLLHAYDPDYKDVLINVYGLVLTNVTGRVLADKSPFQLSLEPLDLHYLEGKLRGMTQGELHETLLEAANRICNEMAITHTGLQQYIAANMKNLSPKLKHALGNKRLESLLICVPKDRPSPAYQFKDRERMDDEAFRHIAAEIRACRYVSDKIAIIKREIHSITDLVDILGGSCLFGDEFAYVFRALGDIELALLLKRLPTHVIDASHHFTESEKEWHRALDLFLADADAARGERIRDLAKDLSVDWP